MQRRLAKRIRRPLTADERERWDRARQEVEMDKPKLSATARQVKAEHDALLAPLRQAIADLRHLRQSQGLSQAVIRERTGIHSKAISRLENDLDANPTLATLIRYANALGKRLVIQFVDEPGSTEEASRDNMSTTVSTAGK